MLINEAGSYLAAFLLANLTYTLVSWNVIRILNVGNE